MWHLSNLEIFLSYFILPVSFSLIVVILFLIGFTELYSSNPLHFSLDFDLST